MQDSATLALVLVLAQVPEWAAAEVWAAEVDVAVAEAAVAVWVEAWVEVWVWEFRQHPRPRL